MLLFPEAYEGDQLRQLVAALCPTIYGHELVKAGLLLSLFGGVRKHGSSSNRVSMICQLCPKAHCLVTVSQSNVATSRCLLPSHLTCDFTFH